MKSLLKPSGDHTPKINRTVDCILQYIAFNILDQKAVLQKHFLLRFGLHNLFGSRKVINILYKFGYCVNYNYVCEVETGYSEVSQRNAKESLTLLLQPKAPNKTIKKVSTHFWVSNFDVLADRKADGGSVNTTHLVAFQNQCEDAVVNKNLAFVERKTS